MNSESSSNEPAGTKNAKSSGSPLRLIVLLLTLAVLVAGFAYDRFVLLPQGDAAVERVVSEGLKGVADRASIREAAGQEPASSSKVGKYDVEEFVFGRLLPFQQGRTVSVVYNGEEVTETYRGGISEEEKAALTAP